MSAVILTLPHTAAAAHARWELYYARREDIEARWPNVGIDDLRDLVRLYDAAYAETVRQP